MVSKWRVSGHGGDGGDDGDAEPRVAVDRFALGLLVAVVEVDWAFVRHPVNEFV